MAPRTHGPQPTLEAVAAVAGVSRATVSRVINLVPTVDPQIVAAVERAIEETGYVPNLAARSLVTRRTGSVALVVSEPTERHSDSPFLERLFTDPYIGRVTAGAQRVLRPRGIHLTILPADGPAHDQVVGYVRQGHVDGVLLVSSSNADPLPARLAALPLPVVLSTRIGDLPDDVPTVDLDQAAGGRLAAQHLLGTGRTRLASVAGPSDVPFARERLAGFLDAVRAAGLDDPVVVEGDLTRASGELAARRLLAALPEVDGVFAASDLMADGASTAFQAAGRRVPEDVAIVGFDDSTVARGAHPPLTTIHQPVEDMASEMARLLLADLDGTSSPVGTAMFTPSLVVRDSA
ncbi:LacI family DNA-binding transcriptional regulator [Cellulosimicrobium arenosum]|uniref:LacI family DNA-binding transcriptional regulator n=1 Tax=Cellulosimicrobium arenosum TaxID=2708133 RepID=A0A927IZI1_9MICO|nr:LacI family DNA-binding transcriptional regulator [Cellulosimicrobium arenosum]MBD8078579.1 LacI family DNA-binding transcriptional regulator [Cellulosimicrobium arenosum]